MSKRKKTIIAGVALILVVCCLAVIFTPSPEDSDNDERASTSIAEPMDTAEPTATNTLLPATETTSPTETPTAQVTSLPSPTATSTSMPFQTATTTSMPSPTTTATSMPSPTVTAVSETASIESGGLGLNRAEWEQRHEVSNEENLSVWYDNDTYQIIFFDNKVWHLQRHYGLNGAAIGDIEFEIARLIPADSVFVETYSPELDPDVVVLLYMSDSLRQQFDDDMFIGGEPGNFIASYVVVDGRGHWLVMGLGNNP